MNPQRGAGITSEEIYEDLCLKIENLEYMPGERLSENELCGVYKVTRHVVRNALAKLKQRRLVDVYPQRGTYVSLIDMEYISDILYMRESVEQEAVARILDDGACAEVVDRLRYALLAQKELLHGSDGNAQFYELDNLFHQALLSAVGRGSVMNLISEPYIHIRRWRNFEIRTEQRMWEIIAEHESLIRALDAEDRTLARECLHMHLDTVSRYSKPLKEKEAQYFV